MLIKDFESNFIVILSKYINETVIMKWFDGTKIKALISSDNKNKKYSDNEKISLKIVEIMRRGDSSPLSKKSVNIASKIDLSYKDFPEKVCSLDYYTIWSVEYEFNRKLLVFLSSLSKRDKLTLAWKDGTVLEGFVDSSYYTSSEEVESRIDKLNPRYQAYHLVNIKVEKVINLSANFDYYDEILHGNTLLGFNHKSAPFNVTLKNNTIYDFKKESKIIEKKERNIIKGSPYYEPVYSPDFTALLMITSLVYKDLDSLPLATKEIKNSIYQSSNKLDSVLLLSYLNEIESECLKSSSRVYSNPLNKNTNILLIIDSLKNINIQNREKIVLLLENNILRNKNVLDLEFLFSRLKKALN